jgi:hypothetical protein
MDSNQWVEFELAPANLDYPVSIRLGDFEARWLAVVQAGSASLEGLGGTARDALVAALAPLGMPTTAALMAEPAMFGASARLRRAQAG